MKSNRGGRTVALTLSGMALAAAPLAVAATGALTGAEQRIDRAVSTTVSAAEAVHDSAASFASLWTLKFMR